VREESQLLVYYRPEADIIGRRIRPTGSDKRVTGNGEDDQSELGGWDDAKGAKEAQMAGQCRTRGV